MHEPFISLYFYSLLLVGLLEGRLVGWLERWLDAHPTIPFHQQKNIWIFLVQRFFNIIYVVCYVSFTLLSFSFSKEDLFLYWWGCSLKFFYFLLVCFNSEIYFKETWNNTYYLRLSVRSVKWQNLYNDGKNIPKYWLGRCRILVQIRIDLTLLHVIPLLVNCRNSKTLSVSPVRFTLFYPWFYSKGRLTQLLPSFKLFTLTVFPVSKIMSYWESLTSTTFLFLNNPSSNLFYTEGHLTLCLL